MHAGSQELILKLVDANLREGDHLFHLARSHPSIPFDPNLSFPSHILRCVEPDGAHRYDLIVMEKAAGAALAEVISFKWYAKESAHVMRIIEELGSCLKEFHMRYGNSQHGDFHASNIFYDEATDQFTFIDVADIGSPKRSKTYTDKEHFIQSLRGMSHTFGATFFADASQAFQAGYSRSRSEPSVWYSCS